MVPGLLNTLPSHSPKPPAKRQADLLRQLLRRASATEWGKRFGFEELARQSDVVHAYQSRVPIHAYDELQQDIERVRRGDADVLWPGQTRHFAVSSGTTAAGKIIPVSRQMLRLNRRFALEIALAYVINTGKVRLFNGKHLALPGYVEEDPAFPGSFVGEVSGLQSMFAPKFFQILHQSLPESIIREPDWDRKLQAIADRTLEMDIRMVAMAPSWGVVLFPLLIDLYNRKHHCNVHTVREIWPNLQLYISGGVALSSYRTLLEQQIGEGEVDFVEVYGASEGFFSLQTSLDDASMLLHLKNGVFFEFIRLGDLGADHPIRYTIEEVELNERYVPVLTTCSGLWAYLLGDVVRFTSLSPHKIVVSGRTAEMLDLYGEAVFDEDARMSVTEACAATDALVRDYHVTTRAPANDRLPTMEWVIEFERRPADVQQFLQALDAHLIHINRHYAIRREAKAFTTPELVSIPVGTFHTWLKRNRNAVGSQTKVPRMSEQRTVLEQVLTLAGDQAQRVLLSEG